MMFRDCITTSINSLKANKSRSALTILGIVIGIAAIMFIASLGSSAKNVIIGELGGLGAETIVIRPGKEPQGPSDIAETLFLDSLKERELEALRKKSNVPDLIDAAPEVLVTGSVSYGNETFKPVILGFSADFMIDTLNLRIKDGISFDDEDIRTRSAVTLIGSRVVEELFGQANPIGEYIQIKGKKFRVMGVFEKRGQVVFFDVDELVLVPYTTAQTYLSGTKHYNQIVARAVSADVVDRAVFDIRTTLRELHGSINSDDDDFSVQTQQGLVKQVSTIIGIFTLFLSLVVAISLVVGGIGIMNIMLVSVTERTREIGLRKAIGATSADILKQFLLESILLTSLGGVVGVVLGSLLSLAGSFGISRALAVNVSFSFPVGAAILGIVSATFVGVVFGLYPARKASQKSPIEALRYE